MSFREPIIFFSHEGFVPLQEKIPCGIYVQCMLLYKGLYQETVHLMGQSQLEGEFPGKFPRAMGIFLHFFFI